MAPKRSKSKGQPKQTQPPSEESKSSSYEPPEARMIGNIAPNEDNIFDEEEEDEAPFAERVRLSLIEQKAELEAAERKEKVRIKQQQRIANETRIAQEARENNQFAPEVITEIIPADEEGITLSRHPLVYEPNALAVYGGPREENNLPVELFSERPLSRLSASERLNASIHSNIFNVINGLDFFVTNPDRERHFFIEVHRFRYSTNPVDTDAILIHNHGEQQRTVLNPRLSRRDDILNGASKKQQLDIINTLARQQEFFKREDCCECIDVIRAAEEATSQACIHIIAGAVDPEIRREFRAHLEEWSCLNVDQQTIICPSQIWNMAREVQHTTQELHQMHSEQNRVSHHTLLSHITQLEQQLQTQKDLLQSQAQQLSQQETSLRSMNQRNIMFPNEQNPIGLQNMLDEDPNFMDMSMQGSSRNHHILVKAEPLPNFDDFQPGSEDCKRVLMFVRRAINLKQDLQRDGWPRRLQHNIDTYWRLTREQSMTQDIKLANAPTKWQDLTPEMMLTWLEILMDKQTKNDLKTEFLSHLYGTKFEINWMEFENATANSFIAMSSDLEFKWNHVLENTPNEEGDTDEFHKPYIKAVMGKLSHQGGSLAFRNDMCALIHKATQDKKRFQDVLHAIQVVVREQLEQLQTSAKFFTQSSQKKKSSWGWDDNDKSSFNPKNKDRTSQSRDYKSSSSKKEKRKANADADSKKPRKRGHRPQCSRCGWDLIKVDGKNVCMRNGEKDGCLKDPRINKTKTPWWFSEIGTAWHEAGYTRGLPRDQSITLANAKERKAAFDGTQQYLLAISDQLLLSNELINFAIYDVKQLPRKRKRIETREDAPVLSGKLLLDTGAIGKSVVSRDFLRKMKKAQIPYTSRKVNANISQPMSTNDNKSLTNQEISFHIIIPSEHYRNITGISIPITALVAKINIDIIVDKATIKEQNLILHFPSHFAQGEALSSLRELPHNSTQAVKQQVIEHRVQENDTPCITPTLQSTEELSPDTHSLQQQMGEEIQSFLNQLTVSPGEARALLKQEERKKWANLQSTSNTPRISKRNFNRLWKKRLKKHHYAKTCRHSRHSEEQRQYEVFLAQVASNYSLIPAYDREGNMTDIPDNKLESIPAEIIRDIHDTAEYTKVELHGSPYLQEQLKQLVYEHKDAFSSTVQAAAAQLTPFELEVDESKWCIPKNRLPVRRTDRERSIALEDIIKILLDKGIIEACTDQYYSHAFLVPKPNGKWRFVLDFKNLNAATTNSYEWPIPDIKDLLHRVGESRPRFFAVFDLTSGYYQAPISEGSRKYTAFKTDHGVYRWKRLPMGLTGAGSFFQQGLVSEVLQGLIHNGVELYLDDCMVHAQTMDEFLDKLRTVFLRFRHSNITLNPAKCKLGLSEVEYVGHTINADGLHFTREKIDRVLNMPRPITKKQLKAFLGLANYFRDHISHHSSRVHPLQELVNNYDRRQASHMVKWTPTTTAAYEDILAAIDACPRLWFIDNHSPIYLQTDASDYGIGAYLYQTVTQEDGTVKEHPIGFISKAIANQHTSWDTPMKEGYAIFYALKKWEYLLRDRRFTILTDHQNLTRLRADHVDTNKMVKRWFMAFQEFDIIEWGYRPGPENEVPDSFSRLCPKEIDEHPTVHLYQLTGEQFPQKAWDTIAQFHNSLDRGHGGITRTLNLLRDAQHSWEGMTEHVRRFIRACPCCQKMDQMKKVIHAYPFTTSAYGLWDTVSVDFIESLRPDEYGNTHIVTIVDNFSRFTDLYPTNGVDAVQAADALLNFIGRYATPKRICTDSGSNFKSDIVRGLIERLGAQHRITTAYSKEQNAIVERQNKEVLRHLRNIIQDKRMINKWSKYLPVVQRIINSSINTSTGLSPAQIVFPDGLVLDENLVNEAHPIYMSSYIRELQEAQANIIAICEQTLRDKDSQRLSTYPTERTVFENGSYVLAEHRPNALRRGPKSKLLPFLRGPMLVKSHDKEGNYLLQDLVSQKLYEYHVTKLRHWVHDPLSKTTPIEAAVTDVPDEFIVEKCLAVKGDPRNQRRKLQFRIRWAGYDESNDTWEPWECCYNNDQVRRFLLAHPNPRFRRLVPSDYIPPKEHDIEDEGDVLA